MEVQPCHSLQLGCRTTGWCCLRASARLATGTHPHAPPGAALLPPELPHEAKALLCDVVQRQVAVVAGRYQRTCRRASHLDPLCKRWRQDRQV